MIQYKKILNKNLINVFKDVLKDISNNGLSNNNHLYITFLTNNSKVQIPSWLKKKYPKEMTIIIQHEYYNLKISNDFFAITLSFNNIKTNLKIYYSSVISFADPYANFGLKLQTINSDNSNIKKNLKNNNVIDFSSFKKN